MLDVLIAIGIINDVVSRIVFRLVTKHIFYYIFKRNRNELCQTKAFIQLSSERYNDNDVYGRSFDFRYT